MSPRDDTAATDALDAIAKLCGCPAWEYPGQVVRDVAALVTERRRLRAACEVAAKWLESEPELPFVGFEVLGTINAAMRGGGK